MSTEKREKPFFKEWLEKLQQESWQLELLISGVAIFAIIESINYINRLDPFLNNVMRDDPNFITGSLVFGVIFLQAGIYIFLLNLIVHVLVRSLWIGAIGLRYVSGDIDYEQLKYSQKFKNYYQRKIGSFDNYIEKLENFSSILFSYTFLLFFILISFLFAGIVFFGLVILLQELLPNSTGFRLFFKSILLTSFVLFGILVAFDFLTLGLLKRIKNGYFSAFYLLIYRFFSTITLSFFWRPMLLNFLDQKYTRRLFVFVIPYLVIFLLVAQSSYVLQGFYPDFNTDTVAYPEILNEYSFNPNYYDEERKALKEHAYERMINSMSIPSKKVDGALGELFIRSFKEDKVLINESDSTLIPFGEEGLINLFFSEFQEGFNSGHRDARTRDQIKLLKDSIADKQLFERLRDSILHDSELEKKEAFRQNTSKIKTILQSSILIGIDERKVNPVTISCDFYIHPDGNAKGLLCFFPLDSLTIGRHYFKIGKVKGKKNLNISDEIYLDTVYHTIPFIFMGK